VILCLVDATLLKTYTVEVMLETVKTVLPGSNP
jgi:hypothetical protein